MPPRDYMEVIMFRSIIGVTITAIGMGLVITAFLLGLQSLVKYIRGKE